jgi:hypothetical protein
MEDGRWKKEDGKRKKEEGRWKKEVGRRKMEKLSYSPPFPFSPSPTLPLLPLSDFEVPKSRVC